MKFSKIERFLIRRIVLVLLNKKLFMCYKARFANEFRTNKNLGKVIKLRIYIQEY